MLLYLAEAKRIELLSLAASRFQTGVLVHAGQLPFSLVPASGIEPDGLARQIYSLSPLLKGLRRKISFFHISF
jgi:hypothetical protein